MFIISMVEQKARAVFLLTLPCSHPQQPSKCMVLCKRSKYPKEAIAIL